MSIEVKVPALPESVTEATVVGWHKKPGDRVARDENLVDLETDKVVLEVPAPEDGVLGKILKDEGATVVADEVLACLEQGETNSQAERPASAKGEDDNRAPGPTSRQGSDDAARDRTAEPDATPHRNDNLSPAVRRMVAEHELDPARIEGTGRDGRIIKEDVIRHLASHEQPAPEQDESPDGTAGTEQAPRQSARPPTSETSEARWTPSTSERPERRAPMTRLRQRIAERLVEAQQNTAMLTTFNECNMQPIMSLRNRYKERFERYHGIKLGIMSFFVKTVIEALKRFPAVNASIDGKDIIYHGYYDIGIAVSTERGLLVPVLRDADQLGFAEIEQAIADFGRRARESKIHIDELTGGTFTITNGGIFGSLMSTPILNPPQSGILGMHRIQDRPVVENAAVTVRPMMYLALSYDHRIIDGREAVQFLVTIKELLEDPSRLLLEV
ncbi:2-oxoglutarate dehydrogenase complex dihydrolipoyllysine-residue succinyltransferase [Nitrococcus mobilis]|uniref:Dihydrolipoyllysine-residue succinyltransferase component of 2-oxoglutarate dehydrogenase complex n=1 Tax=Nitrococcus mobilis Nb-231 TaxID=314278 RepID=A4BP63_9GAMM|nr:2-oxoglutarate dehydrogenase complex dihydrolipoyllysine-residue succinyltransferase [Nitrococcus mobilis]EAR22364.1 2-oxoglutarate dehydrogenase, E2 component, dihydrolipoamide succinyltransferase [Nitrococcus mobilis Nb-231]